MRKKNVYNWNEFIFSEIAKWYLLCLYWSGLTNEKNTMVEHKKKLKF
jgi:hypothetical protein